MPVSTLPAAGQDRPAASAAALAWARLWARPGVTATTWLAALEPLTYVEYLNVLATVDPRTVPATAVSEAPTIERFVPGSAHIRIPVTAKTMRHVTVTVIFEPVSGIGRWVVSDVEPN